MKIPETPANVGAYYGNEENSQWQPNGVIIDSGVGGGIVGSGDAGVHRPPVYPIHVPRHMPGYVMASPYFPPAYPPVPPAPQDDFADYMWMENEEEFDKQVMQQLEEEALMEQCIEAMLEDEQRERHRPQPNGHNHYPTTSNGGGSLSLEEAVSRSTLNPLAAEFVPNRARQPATDEKTETTECRTETESSKEESHTTAPSNTNTCEHSEHSKTEEIIPKPTEPPEVSAADIQPIEKKHKDSKPKEVKKTVKPEVKVKAKPAVVKSETRLPAKKEVKPVKSEVRVEKEDSPTPVVEVVKQSTPPTVEETQSLSKPINYAAAAKANKPKNTSTPPPQKVDKPKPVEKVKEKTVSKDKVKADKPVQRKNSTK